MLKVEIDDMLVKISDDNFTKAKVDSIRIIAQKYSISDILDFKLSFKETLFDFAEKSASAVLSQPISLNDFYDILYEMFENIEKENSEDFEDTVILFEGLFIT